jgi:hypothetical protein
MMMAQNFEVIPGEFNILRMLPYFSASIVSISCGLMDEEYLILCAFPVKL